MNKCLTGVPSRKPDFQNVSFRPFLFFCFQWNSLRAEFTEKFLLCTCLWQKGLLFMRRGGVGGVFWIILGTRCVRRWSMISVRFEFEAPLECPVTDCKKDHVVKRLTSSNESACLNARIALFELTKGSDRVVTTPTLATVSLSNNQSMCT